MNKNALKYCFNLEKSIDKTSKNRKSKPSKSLIQSRESRYLLAEKLIKKQKLNNNISVNTNNKIRIERRAFTSNSMIKHIFVFYEEKTN